MTLRKRILGALALQPMTVQELAICLCASAGYIHTILGEMRARRIVRHVGRIKTSGHPLYIWGAA